ncbi:ParA family protein [Salmonella enterica]
MSIYSFWSPKGGVGKSTHTINAARHYAGKGERVGVIDADFPQYSVKKYCDYTGDKSFGLHIFDGGSLTKFIEKYAGNYDRLYLDLPPRSSQYARELIALDGVKIIVPVIVGDLDEFALMELKELRDDATKYGITDYKLALFLNRTVPNATSKRVDDTKQLLDSVSLPYLKSRLVNRTTAYSNIASGRNLKDLDRKAYNEFMGLLNEVEKL